MNPQASTSLVYCFESTSESIRLAKTSQTGKDICLSATSYHPEAWSPSWTVRTIVSALRSHMATKAVEVGGIEASAARRLVLAYRCVLWSYVGGVESFHLVANPDHGRKCRRRHSHARTTLGAVSGPIPLT